MTRCLKWTLALCLAVALTSAAAAQQRRPGGFGLGGLLMNPGVQKELKLSDNQIDKLKDAVKKVREDHKDDFGKFQDMKPEERQKLLRSIGNETNKAIAGVLDAKQMKRFKQIQWQTNGFRALGEADVQKELKLNDEQKKKLTAIFKDANKKMQELFQGGGDVREKFQELRKEMQEKADKVLTEEQQKTWKDMKGKPFELQRRRPAGNN